MGEKKRKEVAVKTWKKVLFVAAAILFVFVMVISSMGMNWISGIAPIRAGDAVVLDYTIYDGTGTPFLTTDEQLYQQQVSRGIGILYGKQLLVTANQSLRQALYPVTVYSPMNGGSYQEFALYNPEYNAISNAVVGMKTNDKKIIPLPTYGTMTTMLTPEDLKNVQVDIDSLQVGESLLLGVSEDPGASGNSSAVSYVRLAQITRVTDAGIVVDFGYPSVEISVAQFSHQ
jgi:FKBP-type peptidyl-prolyl cis-trans isomerase 2